VEKAKLSVFLPFSFFSSSSSSSLTPTDKRSEWKKSCFISSCWICQQFSLKQFFLPLRSLFLFRSAHLISTHLKRKRNYMFRFSSIDWKKRFALQHNILFLRSILRLKHRHTELICGWMNCRGNKYNIRAYSLVFQVWQEDELCHFEHWKLILNPNHQNKLTISFQLHLSLVCFPVAPSFRALFPRIQTYCYLSDAAFELFPVPLKRFCKYSLRSTHGSVGQSVLFDFN
jgi:hypothetical protein